MTKISRLIFLLLPLALSQATAAETQRPALIVPFSAVAPALDAADDDAGWQRAAVIDHLAPPLNPKPGEELKKTRVLALWTRAALFIRFECDGAPVKIAPSAERDLPCYLGDCVEIFLDPVGDARQFVELQFSPGGGVFDAVHLYTRDVTSDDQGVVLRDIIERDGWFFTAWNCDGLRSAVALSDSGWRVSVAIPAAPLLRRLGVKEFLPGMQLRANLIRFDYAAADGQPYIANWSPVTAGRAHHSPQAAGTLVLSGTF